MVFILLIFFVVTATFLRDTGIEVDLPSAAAAVPLEPESLRIAIAASGAVYIDGDPVDLAGVRARVRRFVSGRGDGSVIVIADERAEAGRLVAVMDAARLAGAERMAVAGRKAGR